MEIFLVGSTIGAVLRGKREDPLGGNSQRKISFGRNRFLALMKKKKEILREEIDFIYTIILFSCFSSFSMVVFLPSMS